MDKSTLDNANPTILNVSALPTRRQQGRVVLQRPESQHDYLWKRASDLGPGLPCWQTPLDDEEAYSGVSLVEEPIDELEIYDLISTISDPEHPYNLGQLSVVNLPDICITPFPSLRHCDATLTTVRVEITPTITHCSLATVIGLAVRARLEQALPPRYRVDVRMKEGAHAQDDQVNKQLADKERVAAALENETLKRVLDKMMSTCL